MYRSNLIVLILITFSLACPPLLERKGITLTCTKPYSKDLINCYHGKIPNGTIAIYKCDNYYTPIDSFEEPPDYKLICNDNMKWMGLGMFYAYSCQLECGTMRGLENQKFVIGGTRTSAERWPWHATIFISQDYKQFIYQCGGTLVNIFKEGFAILTTAHCLLDDFEIPINPNQLRVVLGGQRSDIIKNKNDFNAQVFSVQKVIIHERYVGERELHQNDIGILKLEGLVHITNTVSPVCLSANNDLANEQLKLGSFGDVVGFGHHTNGNGKIFEPSLLLRQAKLPIVHNNGCYQWQKYHLDNSQICAGYLNEKSVCKGDSGGGYVFPFKIAGSIRYYLQGIVSYGYVRNETFCENYGVFTKIHYHSKWIHNQMKTIFSINDFTSLVNVENDDVELLEDQNEKYSNPKIFIKEVYKYVTTESSSRQPRPSQVCPVCSEIQKQGPCSTIQVLIGNPNNDSTEVVKSNENETTEETTRILIPNYTVKPTSSLRIPLNDVTRNHGTVGVTTGPIRFYNYELGGHTDYQDLALNLHNNYRAIHGVPPLRLNEKLTKEALIYANKLIRDNTFINQNPFGENPPSYNKNIFQVMETGIKNPTDVLQIIKQAVNYWYSEINQYNWNHPTTTTFSQIVWRSTTDIGIGVGIGHQGNTFRHVVVATYSPPGNLLGSNYFQSNVFPRRQQQF